MSAKGNIEVYLSQGTGELAKVVDFEQIRQVAASLPGVTTVHDFAGDVDAALAGRIASGQLERAVLAGFTDNRHAERLAKLFEEQGPGETLFSFASFGWLRNAAPTKAEATALAEATLRGAVARVGATAVGQKVERDTGREVLVVGEGPAALSAASLIADAGFPVTLVTPDAELGRSPMSCAHIDQEAGVVEELTQAAASADTIEVLTRTTLLKAAKEGNGFVAWLESDEGKVERRFGAVVAAPEPILVPRFKPYRLAEGEGVMSQSGCEALLRDPEKLDALLPAGEGKTVVFLVGLGQEAQVVSSARALRAALALALRDGPEVQIVTRNLKVAGTGLEALAQECRGKGVVIFKANDDQIPAFEAKDGKTALKVVSPVFNEEVELLADVVVVDEDLEPAPVTRSLIDGLRLEPGPAGLLQPDNVHMTPLGTSHEGVLASGPARGVFDLEGAMIDGAAAVVEVSKLLGAEAPLRVRTEVDDGLCVACLTCYRLCPHDAITFEDFPRFSPLFCQACGICAGACPQNAITMTAFPDARLDAEIGAAAAGPRPAGEKSVLALCCRRSAVEALKLAHHRGLDLPLGLRVVELPCAGRVDEEHILSGLVAGFDGVMVLGCHDDNCRSIRGNKHARNRVDWLRGRLKGAGIAPERLWFGTVASNMSAEVADQCQSFVKKLVELDSPAATESEPEGAEAPAS